MNERSKGKVVPLTFRQRQAGEAHDKEANGIALPISPPGLIQADRMLGYFPNSLKEYYRRALMEYKTVKGIGNQKLRDLIMEPEDRLLRGENEPRKPSKSAPIERDTRLSLDDLKKWFGGKSSHQIGDTKFAFINRFVQQVLIDGDFNGFEVRYNKERTNFHRQALRDIFASGYLSEPVAQILDGTTPHVLISALREALGGPFPTCLIMCGGFYAGIAPVTLVFSEVPGLRREGSGELREEFFISLSKSRFPVVLRGYVIVTASDYMGRLQGRDLVNAKYVLTNEDVQGAGDGSIPYSRIIADGRIDVTKNESGAVAAYSMNIDTTEFPEEVSNKTELKKVQRFDGSSLDSASRRLVADLVPNNEYLDAIVEKFGAGYY